MSLPLYALLALASLRASPALSAAPLPSVRYSGNELRALASPGDGARARRLEISDRVKCRPKRRSATVVEVTDPCGLLLGAYLYTTPDSRQVTVAFGLTRRSRSSYAFLVLKPIPAITAARPFSRPGSSP